MQQLQLQPGALLQAGKYRIEKILGQGGFGITYLATQELLNRRVAIKEFFMRDFCSRAQDTATVTLGTDANREQMERYLAKFLKEAKVIARLDHPGIVRIHDIFEENGTAYYVMEYIEGESLSELVKRRGALPEGEAIGYIRAVAEALKYVHALGINHLDVKPGNIMVRRGDNRVFLLDFGLSKQYDAEGNQTSSTPLGISHGYAPIEQYSPGGVKEFSPQTDIYALGATLYYLVTGNTPPPAGELLNTRPEGFPPGVSAAVRRAVCRSMRPQREDRPATVAQFEALLPAPGKPRKKSGNRRPSKDDSEAGDKSGDETTCLHPEADGTPGGESTPRRNGFGRFFPSNRKKTALIGAAVIAFACLLGTYLYTSQPSYLFGQGLTAYNAEDYSTAFEKFRQAAEKGYDCQYQLGNMYYNGEGTAKNDTLAAKWFTQAAEQGNIRALPSLGYMYEAGKGVTKDESKATEWLRKATEKIEDFRIYPGSMEWFTAAAEQGNAYAQWFLGEIYFSGRNGVVQDYSESIKWFTKLTEQDTTNAPHNMVYTDLAYIYNHLAYVYYYKKRNYYKAFEWYKKAAEQGDVYAQYKLGTMYQHGIGVQRDYTKAKEWYTKVAEQDTEQSFAKSAKDRLEELENH